MDKLARILIRRCGKILARVQDVAVVFGTTSAYPHRVVKSLVCDKYPLIDANFSHS